MATGVALTPSQLVIRNNFPELTQSIDLSSLYSYLVKHGLLTEELKEMCLLKFITDTEKKKRLLTALSSNQQPNSLKDLINCLRESASSSSGLDEHERIAQKLESELQIAINNAEKHVVTQDCQVLNDAIPPITVGQPVPRGNVDGQNENGEQQGLIQPNNAVAHPPPGGIIVPEDESENDDQEPLLQEHNEEPELITQKWFNNRLCKWGCCIAIVCYPIAVILCLLCFIPAGVVTWNDTKDLPTTYDVPVSDNQTVLLPLQPYIDDRFIHSLSLQLTAPYCRGGMCNCESKSIVIPCSNLSKTHTPGVSLASQFFKHYNGLFYLLNGSTIHISYKTLGHFDPASIWIFQNSSMADKSYIHRPKCSDSRYFGYGNCTSLTEDKTFEYNVTNNSFYFLRCFQESVGDCLNSMGRVSWTIDLYWYNFSQYADSNRNVDVVLQNITTKQRTNITLQKSFDPVHYGTDPDKCILIHKFPTSSCEEEAHVSVSDVTKVEDAWLFTALVAVLVILTFSILAVVVHIGCWVSMAKKQQPAPV